MAQINVISVNPSKQTLGALNIENIERVARIYQPGERSFSFPGLKSVCNFIFGLNKSVTPAFSVKLALIRTIAAGMLVLSAMTAMPLEVSGYSLQIVSFVIAGMMLVGFFSRLVSFAAFSFTAVVTGISIHESLLANYDIMAALANPSIMLSIVIASGLLAMSILGPGRLSIDQILNRAIYKTLSAKIIEHRARRRERKAEIRLSYKAWRNA